MFQISGKYKRNKEVNKLQKGYKDRIPQTKYHCCDLDLPAGESVREKKLINIYEQNPDFRFFDFDI
jgi:hypothetical protein